MQRGALPPLVKAKLSPPEPVDASLRPETVDLLGSYLRRRVTLVCAPAGYGKTTVTREMIARLELRTVWYKLDVLDQDPVALIASLVEALSHLYEDFGSTIRDRLANAHDVPYPAEQMTAEFVAEASDVVTDDLHVVLDDYHEAADSAAFNVALDYLIANLPPQIRLIVLSRYEPAFAVAKLRLDGELGVVGIDELRFGPGEVLDVVAKRSGASLTLDQAQDLADLTEGWPASVVLAAMAAQWVGVEALESALSDPRLKQDVFSYLAEQVYSRESAEVRAFLRRTCCLEYVTADLSARLAGLKSAHKILRHLQANGVFTFAAAESDTFRYHNLFREFLRRRCIQEDGSASFHRLQIETASALEELGDPQRAVDLCLAANEPRLGLDIVGRAGETNLDAFRSDTLESWLERLPDHMRETDAWARLIAAQVAMRAGLFDLALDHIAAALERFDQNGDRQGLYHALSAQERTLFWQGRAAASSDACRKALEVARTTEQRVHMLISLGAALEADCRWSEATSALEAARKLADGAFPGELARLAAHSAYIAHNTGYYRQAMYAVEAAAKAVLRYGSPSLQMAFLNLAGANHLFMAEWPRARETLDAARELGERCSFVFLMALVDDVDGQLAAATGDLARAETAVRKAIHAPSIVDDPYCKSMALCHAGTFARRSGDLPAATSWYTASVEAADQASAPVAFVNAAANLAFCRDDYHASQRSLDAIVRQAERLNLQFVLRKVEYFSGVLEYRHGGCDAALSRLAVCIPHQLELGHLNFLAQELVLEPQMALDFIGSAADDQTAEAVIDLIARHWNGLGILVACQQLTPAAGVAATLAAGRHREEAELATILAKGARSRFPEVRRTAAGLRRARRVTRGSSPDGELDLTRRETQILALMAAGRSNAEIAERLVVSPATVKTHVNHIFAKLGVHDRVQAVLLYRASADHEEPKH